MPYQPNDLLSRHFQESGHDLTSKGHGEVGIPPFDLGRGDRLLAGEHPAQFLANCWEALRLKPDLLFSQLARGFTWRKEFSPDRVARAQELIDLFQVPWPPREATW